MANQTRLIIQTDSRKKSDVNTFRAAALTLAKIYKAKYAKQNDTIKVVFVSNGLEIANAINSVQAGKIITLDIISHGNQGGIHISRNLLSPVKSGFIQRQAHVALRKYSDRPQTMGDAEYIEESMHGLYSDYFSKVGVSYYYNQTYDGSPNVASLSDIKFDRFADGAVVEFHGCRTAEIVPILNSYMKDNFAKNFSDSLKNKGIVIGHLTNAAPDKNPNGNINDYRYGLVRVYKSGDLIKDKVERATLKFLNSSSP